MVQRCIMEKMRYKLPYEDILDKKPLFDNVEENKRKMNANGHRYACDEIDAYAQQHHDEFEGEQQLLEDNEGETYDGDLEEKENKDEYQASDEFDNEEDIDINFEVDLELFRNKNYEEEILDEDETNPDTKQSSDDEEEQAERISKRDGRRQRLVLNAKRSGKDKCKLIKRHAIAEVMLEKINKEPEMSAPMIREEFRNKFNILIFHEQEKIARCFILDKLKAECNEHFARLRNYEMELLRPGSGAIEPLVFFVEDGKLWTSDGISETVESGALTL
ncbi:hypothetical protein F2Q68_00021347 [Brassica cretica]|uniref:Uncharacterized protein n=1 Tax=Brassica cretica TaxID=69181 RepID=A0A8S9FRD3_BRACR|nr:hypothetical protein F2Q68_00021347 [Brassica cretica]